MNFIYVFRTKNIMNHYIFLIDNSYSMNTYLYSICNIVNKFIQNLRHDTSQESFISIAYFSSSIDWLLKTQNTKLNIPQLSSSDFKKGTMTALYDSVSQVILEFGITPEIKTYFYIITDGDDNDSVEYNKEYADNICKEAIKNGGWKIKHFDTQDYSTLDVPKVQIDINDLSCLLENLTV